MNNFFKQKNRKDSGFTLVETLVGLAIFAVSILALLSIIASGISDTGYAKKKIIAGYLAQEGIEYIRNLRDTYVLYDVDGNPEQGWSDFNIKKLREASCDQLGGCYLDNSSLDYKNDKYPMRDLMLFSCAAEGCINLWYEPSTGKYGYASGVDSGFSRKITTYAINPDQTKVSSTVSWMQGSGTYSITFSEVLFNWVE